MAWKWQDQACQLAALPQAPRLHPQGQLRQGCSCGGWGCERSQSGVRRACHQLRTVASHKRSANRQSLRRTMWRGHGLAVSAAHAASGHERATPCKSCRMRHVQGP